MGRVIALLFLILGVAGAGSVMGRHGIARAQPAGYPFNLTWAQQSLGSAPSARSAASMAFHAPTGTVLLFGGYDGSGSLGDTWIWDGTAWSQLTPVTSPPPRDSASIAFDAANGSLVLFGGQVTTAAGRTLLDDTWVWNGETWMQADPAASPSARSGAALAYDPASQTLVLFGGSGESGVLGDTWTWDGTTWTEQSPATSPAPRFDASMISHTPTGTVLLFGGNGHCSPNPCDDTWFWGGDAWTEAQGAVHPSGRYGAGMAIIGGQGIAAGTVVLFGGFAILGPVPGSTVLGGTQTFDDTWTFNGEQWTQWSLTTGPSARAFASMASDDTT
ncbi:MAG: Kelch repeat-containing protein, partial [Dehalococcoidia bacterium]